MTLTIDKPPGYKGVGRPCSLTTELQDTICKYISEGNYLSTACNASGITQPTLRAWLDKGKAEEESGDIAGQFSLFLSAVKRAEAEREAIIVSRLVDAAMPGVRKRVTKPILDRGLPVLDEHGNIKTITEETETGGEWLAAATYLERRYPERWARPTPINQQGGGNTYNINIEKAIVDAAGKFDAAMSRLADRAEHPLALSVADDTEQAVTPVTEAENTIIEGGN